MVYGPYTKYSHMHDKPDPLLVKWSKHSVKFSNFLLQQINGAPSQDGEQNGLMGRVDEGVDEFFSKKVTKMNSK